MKPFEHVIVAEFHGVGPGSTYLFIETIRRPNMKEFLYFKSSMFLFKQKKPAIRPAILSRGQNNNYGGLQIRA